MYVVVYKRHAMVGETGIKTLNAMAMQHLKSYLMMDDDDDEHEQ